LAVTLNGCNGCNGRPIAVALLILPPDMTAVLVEEGEGTEMVYARGRWV